MSDVNWISIEYALKNYFVTIEELNRLAENEELDTKSVTIDGKDYLRLMEHQISRRFERREVPIELSPDLKAVVLGIASSLLASLIYDKATKENGHRNSTDKCVIPNARSMAYEIDKRPSEIASEAGLAVRTVRKIFDERPTRRYTCLKFIDALRTLGHPTIDASVIQLVSDQV